MLYKYLAIWTIIEFYRLNLNPVVIYGQHGNFYSSPPPPPPRKEKKANIFCACDFSLERKKSKNRKICQMKEFCVPRQTRLKRKKVKKIEFLSKDSINKETSNTSEIFLSQKIWLVHCRHILNSNIFSCFLARTC